MSRPTARHAPLSPDPEVVADVRQVILEDGPVGRNLLDSMVVLSRSLNQKLRQHGLLGDDLDVLGLYSTL